MSECRDTEKAPCAFYCVRCYLEAPFGRACIITVTEADVTTWPACVLGNQKSQVSIKVFALGPCLVLFNTYFVLRIHELANMLAISPA